MLNNSVLHYPTIEIENDTWLKSCLCVWDKVYRIVPASYQPNDSDEVKIAIDQGLVENITLSCEDLEATAADFNEFWNNVPFLPAGAERDEDEYIRLYPEKVDVKIRPMLEALSKKISNDGCFRLSKEIANLYMLFLAENVSRRRNIPKLTHDDDMYAVMHYFQNDANFDELLYDLDNEEATASLVLPAVLPKALEFTTMDKILEYRSRHFDELADFRRIISGFSEEIAKIEDKSFAKVLAEDFAGKLYNNQISFAKNMKIALTDIPFAMISVGLPTTLSAIGVLSIGASNPFDYGRIGTSCIIGAIASIADVARSKRKEWKSTDSNFLLGLNRITAGKSGMNFRIPKYDRILEEFIND